MAGTAGTSSEGAPDSVIGCSAASWPQAGWYFAPPPVDEFSTREEAMLARMEAAGLSGDGTVVVGTSQDQPYRREATVTWSATQGLVDLPPSLIEGSPFEARGMQASCNGSVVLQQRRLLDSIHRTQGGQALDVLPGPPSADAVTMSPDASVIVDGLGYLGEFSSTPELWSAATGTVPLSSLTDEAVYGVAPDGTLIAGNADVLFEYDPATDVKTPIGMAAVDFPDYGARTRPSIKVSPSGEAWAQAADLHYDSFLVWRAGAAPRSVTCPASCRVVDISGTGAVVLVNTSAESSTKSSIWTESSGFVDLTSLFQALGVDLTGRELRAVALSDDGRAVAGNVYRLGEPYYPDSFFYAVLPASTYQ